MLKSFAWVHNEYYGMYKSASSRNFVLDEPQASLVQNFLHLLHFITYPDVVYKVATVQSVFSLEKCLVIAQRIKLRAKKCNGWKVKPILSVQSFHIFSVLVLCPFKTDNNDKKFKILNVIRAVKLLLLYVHTLYSARALQRQQERPKKQAWSLKA